MPDASGKHAANLGSGLVQTPLFPCTNNVITGYLMILAVDALQIAMGEKNITYAILPAQDRLFTFMQRNGGNVQVVISAAITELALPPLDSAVSWAQPASLHFFYKYLTELIHDQ